MIVLDDPANPFPLIFLIRKIPNDLLDLERLNRPGESVPSMFAPCGYDEPEILPP
jgi:hypothetical protein